MYLTHSHLDIGCAGLVIGLPPDALEMSVDGIG
jgi:hypothetical protein